MRIETINWQNVGFGFGIEKKTLNDEIDTTEEVDNVNYRSIKKVISLRNISKVFSHFYYTIKVYVLPYMLLNSHAILFL